MKQIFKNIKISAIYSFVPETIVYFDDEVIDADSARNRMIKKSMGYGGRRRTKHSTSTLDMHVYALNYLMSNNIITKEEIGGIIVTAFTPPYYAPQMGDLLKMKLELSNDIYTVDNWDGCCGYLSGLMEAAMLLNYIENDKKVLLLTGDSYNHLPENNQTMQVHMIKYGGDAWSVTVLEHGSEKDNMPMIIKSHGSRMMEKKGGSFSDFYGKDVVNPEILMDNPNQVFRFFQNTIPACINEMIEYSDVGKEQIAGYSVIQANSFAVNKYAEALDIPYEKMPSNLVERYGDASASINPIIIDELLEKLEDTENHKFMVVGYGSGLKYGAAILNMNRDIKHGIVVTDL